MPANRDGPKGFFPQEVAVNRGHGKAQPPLRRKVTADAPLWCAGWGRRGPQASATGIADATNVAPSPSGGDAQACPGKRGKAYGLVHRPHRPPRVPLPRLGIIMRPASTAVSNNLRQRSQMDADCWHELFDTEAGFAVEIFSLSQSLNLSQFVAHQIWGRCSDYLSGAGLIACKDVGVIEAFSCP